MKWHEEFLDLILFHICNSYNPSVRNFNVIKQQPQRHASEANVEGWAFLSWEYDFISWWLLYDRVSLSTTSEEN